ncbi:MAG TPA: metallophosphoesterase [Solirubrobacterales bacterium]|jgi:predicted MPP superfamily phosphohydrolase
MADTESAISSAQLLDSDIRIAHLSDLHAAMDGEHRYGQERVVPALLRDLNERAEERDIDLFVFSGDLSFDGTTETLARGRQLLLDPLRDAYPETPIVLAPGNHDVDLTKIDFALDTGLEMTLATREAVEARLRGEAINQDRLRLQDWDAFQREWDAGCSTDRIGPGAFSHRFDLGGHTVAVGSFDTAWRSRDSKKDRGRLILGVDQLRAFLESAQECDLTVVTFHHPPTWLVDFDNVSAKAALEQFGAVVLTGHDHVADPSLTVTPRGGALYCRAPCSYEDPEYMNGYALIDIEIARNRSEITLRRWSSSSEMFQPDLDSAPDDGRFRVPWPTGGSSAPVYHLSDADVIQPLVSLAQDHSLLPDSADDQRAGSISDFAVQPRFWPVPYSEAFNRSVEREYRPKQVDPLEEIENARALIVAGPRMSGVTTSLLLTLERHYRASGTHIPAYVLTDRRFSRRKILEAIDGARRRVPGQDAKVLLAIDDADPLDSRALGRLVRILLDNPDVSVILGCHGDAHKVLGETLDQHVETKRVFLAPFGRRQTRQLVAQIAGADGNDLVTRILRVVQRQALPRNPLNLAALVSVLTREPNLTAINETGLLDSYIAVLLDNPAGGVDPEGLNMDFRRREHLLLRIAEHVVNEERTRIHRTDIEGLVIAYYKQIGWLSGSAGQLIESLIRRRVLAEDDRGVGFRYPALLHLFAAKAVTENPDFAQKILDDPKTYSAIIRHVAGLKRDDKEILSLAMNEAIATRERLAPDIGVEEFEKIEDRDGWSKIESLDHVRRLLESRPAPPSDEELDEIHDEAVEEVDEAVELRPFSEDESDNAITELMESYKLLCAVLQSSELVPEPDFRAEVMKEAISGWGIVALFFSVEEDSKRSLQAALTPLFGSSEDDDSRESMIEHLARVLVLSMMATGLFVELGTVHQRDTLEGLLENSDFMSSSANAMFTGLLFAMLQFNGWPTRLEEVFDQHGDHPMVRELVRRWCLYCYYSLDLPENELAKVESLLVKILSHNLPATRSVAASSRGPLNSTIREELQFTRRKILYKNELNSRRDQGERRADLRQIDLDPEVRAAMEEIFRPGDRPHAG